MVKKDKFPIDPISPNKRVTFTQLFAELDSTTKTLTKVKMLANFFKNAEQFEKIWGLFILLGNKPRKIINSTNLKKLAQEYTGTSEWMFDECYTIVGDLGETIALLVEGHKTVDDQKEFPIAPISPISKENIQRNTQLSILSNTQNSLQITHNSLEEWITNINSINIKDLIQIKEFIFSVWEKSTKEEIFVFNKILMGSLRIGVSKGLVIKGLAKAAGIDEGILQHKLSGSFDPGSTTIEKLLETQGSERKRSYPFFLASQIDSTIEEVGDPKDFIAEWKWDGIRAQIMRRDGEVIIWSRGEELISGSFPELLIDANKLPNNTVLDGEILIYKDRVLTFNDLQQRLNRKTVTSEAMKNYPAFFYCYDILEFDSDDLRNTELVQRKEILKNVFLNTNFERLRLSEDIKFETWEELKQIREKSRQNSAEGIMLKRKNSIYKNGRKKGDWWKWKIEPFSVDAVMIYAQRGHGRRANLYTDYTFAVWGEDGKLVPFAKAYSGLSDEEINKVNKFVLSNTLEKFGPVRSVKPTQVFELGFEGIQKSPRHKSGIAVRFPRILRWRTDKKAEEANNLEYLQDLLNLYESGGK